MQDKDLTLTNYLFEDLVIRTRKATELDGPSAVKNDGLNQYLDTLKAKQFTAMFQGTKSGKITTSGVVTYKWSHESQTRTGTDLSTTFPDANQTYTLTIVRAADPVVITIGTETDRSSLIELTSIGTKYVDSFKINSTEAFTVPPELPEQILILDEAFAGSDKFNDPNVSTWDVSKVVSMQNTFKDCAAFDQPLADWDTSNVSFMTGMFSGAVAYEQNLNGWDVSKIPTKPDDWDLNNTIWLDHRKPLWGVNPNLLHLVFGANGDINFSASVTVEINGETRYIDAQVLGTAVAAGSVLKLDPRINPEYGFQSTGGLTEVKSFGKMGLTSAVLGPHIRNVPPMVPASLTNYTNLFYGATNFNDPNVQWWDVSEVVAFTRCFSNCPKFNQPLNDWVVTKGRSFAWMFSGASVFNQPLDRWVMDRATNTESMFSSASKFDQDLSSWTLYNVTRLNAMFQLASSFNSPLPQVPNGGITNWTDFLSGCTSFNQPLTGLNTTGAELMGYFLQGCTSFNQSLDSLDTSNATTFTWFLGNCAKFNQPINLNLDKATKLAGLFYGCRVFNQPLDHITLPVVQDITQMFMYCNAFDQPVFRIPNPTVTQAGQTFYDATVFDQPLDHWPLVNVVRCNSMFQGAKRFNQPLTSWVFDKATAAEIMFYGAENFDQPVNHFKFKLVTNFSLMFGNAKRFNQPLDQWDMSKVTNLSRMFEGAWVFNQDLSSWDTSNVTTFKDCFLNAKCFNGSLAGWDTSKATTLDRMFYGATSFNQPVNHFRFPLVTDLSGLFYEADSFNQPLDQWDVSHVTILNAMFAYARSFNQPLANWDISKVTSFNRMFQSAESYNQDLSNWDTSKALGWMVDDNTPAWVKPKPFWGCVNDHASYLAIRSPDSSSMQLSFSSSGKFEVCYNSTANGWVTADRQLSLSNAVNLSHVAVRNIEGGDLLITSSNRSFEILSFGSGLTSLQFRASAPFTLPRVLPETLINLDGMFMNCINFNDPNIRSWDVRKARGVSGMFQGATSFNQDLSHWSFPHIFNEPSDFKSNTGNWLLGKPAFGVDGDYGEYVFGANGGEVSVYPAVPITVDGVAKAANTSHAVPANATVKIAHAGLIQDYHLTLTGAKRAVRFGTTRVGSLRLGTEIEAVPSFLPYSVKALQGTFEGAVNFNDPNVNYWDTSEVISFSNTFAGCTSFDQPLTQWRVTKAMLLTNMFLNCRAFNHRLEHWTTDSVVDMSGMFEGASAFNRSLDHWRVSQVTDMSNMFRNAIAFNQPLNNWQPDGGFDNVHGMFEGATSFNQPLNRWRFASSPKLEKMFYNATSFSQNLTGWALPGVASAPTKFSEGSGLTADQLPIWGASHTDAYYRVLNGTVLNFSNPVTLYVDGVAKPAAPQHTVTTANPTALVRIPHTADNPQYTLTTTEGIVTVASFGTSKLTRVALGKDVKWVTPVLPTSVYSLYGVFAEAADFNDESVSYWDVSRVTNLTDAFMGCVNFNQSLDNWDVRRVQSFHRCFYLCKAFNQSLSKWRTYSAVTMRQFLQNCITFDQPLAHLFTYQVKSFDNFLTGAIKFNQQMENFNVHMAETLRSFFYECSSLKQRSTLLWDTQRVTNMGHLFRKTSTNYLISDWDVRRVTDVTDMFREAIEYDRDLSSMRFVLVPTKPVNFDLAAAKWPEARKPKFGPA